jgi:vacuolar-type H+-ATPase subunit H
VTTTDDWWIVGAALAIGAALGSMITLRMVRAGYAEKLRLTTEDLMHKQVSAANELRNAQARANQELERARLSFKRELTSASEAPRAALLEAEERLRAAYDEMDRLRRSANAPREKKRERASDFASTEVMLDETESGDQGFAPTEVMGRPKPSPRNGAKSGHLPAPPKAQESRKSGRREVSPSGFPSTEVMDEGAPPPSPKRRA